MNNAKKAYTQEDIERILNEVERRIDIEVKDGMFTHQDEIKEYLAVMMQGVYSTLMVTSDDWPSVVTMLDKSEDERFWKRLGYED